MSGKIIGYVRVSTEDQTTVRQLQGEHVDKLFEDKLSGKSMDRIKLNEMLDYIREGDVLLVHSMDRLARNLDDLRKIVRDLTTKSVTVRFIKESLIFTGDDSPMSNLLLSVMGAFAEFERSLILERQREGISIAKRNGVYKGKKKYLDDNKITYLKQQIKNGRGKSELAREFGISRETVYCYLRSIQA